MAVGHLLKGKKKKLVYLKTRKADSSFIQETHFKDEKEALKL